MRVLIVNNGQRYPSQLRALFPSDEVEIISVDHVVTLCPVATHDLILLSGSNQKPILYYRSELQPILTWIQNQNKPLLGICYGAELLAEAYGGRLHHLGTQEKLRGFFTTMVPDNRFGIPPRVCLYESHQWIIESVQPPLQPIFSAPGRGVLMFYHENLPQAGVIFHPDKFIDETDALLVLRVVLNYFGLSHATRTSML